AARRFVLHVDAVHPACDELLPPPSCSQSCKRTLDVTQHASQILTRARSQRHEPTSSSEPAHNFLDLADVPTPDGADTLRTEATPARVLDRPDVPTHLAAKNDHHR